MIKTTLIGHACLLFQTKESLILTDPVWFDYLYEDMNVLCPGIRLDKDKVPSIDILNISHRHQDHLDVRTLAWLSENKRIIRQDTVILAPDDSVLLEVLNELGFSNIRVLADFETIHIRDVSLTPTPSLNREEDDFVEHGLLVHDGEVTIWNQIDTVVNQMTLDKIYQIYGQLDFMHAQYLPLMEGKFSYHKPLNLPFDQYGTSLKVVKALGPKFAVPASAGFRYRDELNFLNQYTFPTNPESFLRDLADFCPEVKCEIFLPGDVAIVEQNGSRIEKQGSNFVKLKENDGHLIAFKPVMEVPRIQTLTQDREQYEKEMENIKKFVEYQMLERILKSEMLPGWKHWKIIYQLEVFGQKESEVWSVDFSLNDPKIQKGSLGKINLYEGIASSSLLDLIEEKTSWDYLALCGNYRTFNNIYRVTNGNYEFYPLDNIDYVLEPLMEIFPTNQNMTREKFMKDIRKWKKKS